MKIYKKVRRALAVLFTLSLILSMTLNTTGCGKTEYNDKYPDEQARMYNYKINEDLGGMEIVRYFGVDEPEVVIPAQIAGEPVTSIGNSAFKISSGITSVIIPDSVTHIARAAFSDCESLTTASISSSVKDIQIQAFYNCVSLKEILVDENNEVYSSGDGLLFNKDKSLLMQYPIGKEGDSYEIPESVKVIGNSAFVGSKLTSLTIPDSVTNIGVHAFTYCEDLQNITYKGKTYSYENIDELYDAANNR